MRCQYCNTLIVHRFNGRYNRMDRKRKRIHEQNCPENPNVKERKIQRKHAMARLMKREVDTYDIEKGKKLFLEKE